jgi:hypothetical protein
MNLNLREAITYLTWCGLKQRDRCPLTKQEFEKFCHAHDVSMSKAGMLFIKPEDYEYTRGQPFRE